MAARSGSGSDAVVVALAREADQMQQRDRERVQRYERAGARYLREFQRQGLADLALAMRPRAIEGGR